MSVFQAQSPTGSVNGTNTLFTVAINLLPITSFEFYRNGVLQGTSDYSWSQASGTATITTSSPPQTGDNLNSWIWQQ